MRSLYNEVFGRNTNVLFAEC